MQDEEDERRNKMDQARNPMLDRNANYAPANYADSVGQKEEKTIADVEQENFDFIAGLLDDLDDKGMDAIKFAVGNVPSFPPFPNADAVGKHLMAAVPNPQLLARVEPVKRAAKLKSLMREYTKAMGVAQRTAIDNEMGYTTLDFVYTSVVHTILFCATRDNTRKLIGYLNDIKSKSGVPLYLSMVFFLASVASKMALQFLVNTVGSQQNAELFALMYGDMELVLQQIRTKYQEVNGLINEAMELKGSLGAFKTLDAIAGNDPWKRVSLALMTNSLTALHQRKAHDSASAVYAADMLLGDAAGVVRYLYNNNSPYGPDHTYDACFERVQRRTDFVAQSIASFNSKMQQARDNGMLTAAQRKAAGVDDADVLLQETADDLGLCSI